MNWLSDFLASGLALVCALTAWGDIVRHPAIVATMHRLNVPLQLMPWLALAKGAAAVGLLVGIVVQPVAIAAAAGMVVYFSGAVHVHVRVRDGAAQAAPSFVFLTIAMLLLLVSIAR